MSAAPKFFGLPDHPALLELQERRQWVGWRYEQRGEGKPTKPPVNPFTGRAASTTDPTTWGKYDDACEAVVRYNLEGVGYVLTADDGLSGIDLDDCRDPQTAKFESWAREVVVLAETYAEVSPSGAGVRMLSRGKVPSAIKCKPANVEVYGTGRYLTLTGRHIEGTPETIQPAERTLDLLRRRVDTFKKQPEQAPIPAAAPFATPVRQHQAEPDQFFRTVNGEALRNLSPWVRELFPMAVFQPGTGAWRVSSRGLGRALQEDLSISPAGIVDFGTADMGHPRDGKYSPTWLVAECRSTTPAEAALWLCDRLGIQPERIGWQAQQGAPEWAREAPASAAPASAAPVVISAQPFVWRDPRAIPPRRWVYARHYIRQFVSMTIAPGGVGKSSLSTVESLAIATGRSLLDIQPGESCPVWMFNLEDPYEELERRIAAAMMHFNIAPSDVADRLFLNSGRGAKLVVATATKTGAVIARPVVDALKREIIARGVGVLTIDPFVSCHEVAENDNPAINVVMSAWREVADETNCAIELVHHSRKTNGQEVTDEDGRGGSSQHGAARAMRVLNRMSKDEAERAGVENRRQHFRTTDGKMNLAPGSDQDTWFQLVSVDLGNETEDRPGDHVAVVAPWSWPNAFDGVQLADLKKVQDKVSEGRWRKDPQSPQWVGHAVAEVLGLDPDSPKDKTKIKTLLKTWTANRMLKVVSEADEKGNQRPFVKVGERA